MIASLKNIHVAVTWSRTAQGACPAVNRRTFNTIARRAIRETLAAVVQEALSSTRYEVALSLVNDDEIHELNAHYRGKNKPTDVLSFAQNEGEDFPVEATENGAQVLGDIVISIETAQRQAAERAHSLEEETQFLCVHGALHLLGFDHMNAKDRRRMWKQQDQIVERLQARRKSLHFHEKP